MISLFFTGVCGACTHTRCFAGSAPPSLQHLDSHGVVNEEFQKLLTDIAIVSKRKMCRSITYDDFRVLPMTDVIESAVLKQPELEQLISQLFVRLCRVPTDSRSLKDIYDNLIGPIPIAARGFIGAVVRSLRNSSGRLLVKIPPQMVVVNTLDNKHKPGCGLCPVSSQRKPAEKYDTAEECKTKAGNHLSLRHRNLPHAIPRLIFPDYCRARGLSVPLEHFLQTLQFSYATQVRLVKRDQAKGFRLALIFDDETKSALRIARLTVPTIEERAEQQEMGPQTRPRKCRHIHYC